METTLRPLTPAELAEMAVNGWSCAHCSQPATHRVVGPGAFRLCGEHAEETRRNLEAR